MRYESEMIAPIRQRLSECMEGAFVFEEFGVGYGVADLVAVRLSDENVGYRRKSGMIAMLPHSTEVQVLRALREFGVVSFHDLLEHTGISPKRLRYETLRFMRAENYIEEIDSDHFRLRNDYTPVAQEIWAVEAKLKNWFEGVCQARRYQHFAHRTYLAIYAPYRRRVCEETLHEQNVGLIEVSDDKAEILFHPDCVEPHNEALFLMSNEKIWSQVYTAV
jgi:hypothetical protein